MSASDQVAYETRLRPRYAALFFAAAVLIVASQLIQLSGPKTNVNELTLDLILAHRRFPLDLIAAVIDAFGFAALAFGLTWLQQIASARNPEQQRFVRWLALVGGLLSAVTAVVYAIVIAVKANEFVSSGNQSYPEANHLTSGTLLGVLQLLGLLGSFMLGIGFIWISLNVMRVGLLPKLLGYVGVAVGAFTVFPQIGGTIVPILEAFWLAAVAVLIWGRWPQGTPPAWEEGVAVPWPSPQRAAPPPRREPRPRRGRQPAPAAVAVSDEPAAPRATAAKRKRKRRR